MCGIAGRLAVDGSAGEDVVQGMSQAIAHRGPDGDGLWQDPSGTCLAHRRLAIIDLSPGGAQPMHDGDGRHVIVFNGEIYNHGALRGELEAAGVRFRSSSDTEVLLEAWALWGPDCLPRLRGMFAFTVWDRRERVGWLVRDGLGIKPLYYARAGDTLLFASELRALLASGQVDARLDPVALADYFETGSVPEPQTLVRDVRMLPAGHVLRWEQGRTTCTPHWAPALADGAETGVVGVGEGEGEGEGEGGDVARVRDALRHSVSAHFVSDVPVAMFLSGGVDSTALLALAAQAGHAQSLLTFTVGVDDPRLDESQAAADTARHFGVRHARLDLDVARVGSLLDAYLDAVDMPSVDGFNTWVVSGLAHDAGAKVALSGLGGDELFGGYPSFGRVPALARALDWAVRVPAGPALASTALATVARLAPGRAGQAQRLAAALERGGGIHAAHRAYRGLFAPGQARLLAAHLSGCTVSPVALPPAPPARDPRDQVSLLEITGYMRNQLLRDSDVMSMAHGLEVRLPLVDTWLYAAVGQVPAARRLRAGKQMLLDAVPEIPDAVRTRPKRGFRFPFERWIAQGLAGRMPADLPVPITAWYQQWAVLVIMGWMQRNGVRA